MNGAEKQRKQKRFAQVNQRECVGCGCCVKVCPKQIISIYKGQYAVICQESCLGCGLCVKECPADLILLQERGENENKGGYE